MQTAAITTLPAQPETLTVVFQEPVPVMELIKLVGALGMRIQWTGKDQAKAVPKDAPRKPRVLVGKENILSDQLAALPRSSSQEHEDAYSSGAGEIDQVVVGSHWFDGRSCSWCWEVCKLGQEFASNSGLATEAEAIAEKDVALSFANAMAATLEAP